MFENEADIRNCISLKETLTKLNIDGACEKSLFRINGKLAIVKKRLQENSYDNIAEGLVYRICERLQYPCSPAGVLGIEECYSEIDEAVDLEHASKLVKMDEGSFSDFYRALKRLPVTDELKINVLKMGLIDCMTRQLDRSYTNFGFYKINGVYRMYRLYDNGLSLFSASRFREDKNIDLGYSESLVDKISFIVRELRRFNISDIFNRVLTVEFLESIMIPYSEYIKNTNGNDVHDIVRWVLEMQSYIRGCLLKSGIRLYIIDEVEND